MIYNYPFTVDIMVLPDWNGTIVIQDSKTDTLYSFTADSCTFVREYVIPDGDALILNKPFLPLTILTLSALIVGLYNDTLMVPDTVTVKLHNSIYPFELVDSKNGVLDSL